MFDRLSDKLAQVFKKLKGRGHLTEAQVTEALREVRLALLEADVNYKVTKGFIEQIRERAVGEEVLRSLTPAQQVIKIVHEELTALLGGEAPKLDLSGRPPVAIMLVGLQGSGKTTTAAKIARRLKAQGRQPYLVPADVQRPAAIEQLKRLAADIQVGVYDTQPGQSPVAISDAAMEAAYSAGYDTVILDTAGRLHIDGPLMEEIKAIKGKVAPREILLVADAMTGQDAVAVAQSFDDLLKLTGVILTKVEGDARGGRGPVHAGGHRQTHQVPGRGGKAGRAGGLPPRPPGLKDSGHGGCPHPHRKGPGDLRRRSGARPWRKKSARTPSPWRTSASSSCRSRRWAPWRACWR